MADANLISHRRNLLIKDLPGLDTTTTNEADSMLINTAIGNVTTVLWEGQMSKKDQEAEKVENRLVKRFGQSTLRSLTNICQVDNQAMLPPVYQAMAETEGKAQERQVVQNAVDKARRLYNWHFQTTVTPEVMKKYLPFLSSVPT